ncbi:MAG: LacI family DNA-binding transcriptional regulator [Lentisphaeria bacterium]|nr:LacI family DNA-binding transcriptional regulator [Lentisphaeria bacterium]
MKTLSAIARELGVSAATVSYVYHGKWQEKRIHPDLAARVQASLRAERGRPDPLGRQLQSGRTQTVGLLLPHLEQSYFLRLLAGVEERLSASGYMLCLANAHRRREGREVELVERLLARRVDALLLSPLPCSDLSAKLGDLCAHAAVPLVFVDTYLSSVPAARVTTDNVWGAREITRALVGHGCRRVLFLGGDPQNAAIQDRYRGYCDGLEEAGLAPGQDSVLWARDVASEFADAVRGVFSSGDRPDAIVADSFFRFAPVFEILADLGLSHPSDVVLAGFDRPREGWGHGAARAVVQAPLLMALQRAQTVGLKAADVALRALGGEDVSHEIHAVRPRRSWLEEEDSPW